MNTVRFGRTIAALLLAAAAGTAAAQQAAAPVSPVSHKIGFVDAARVIRDSRESQKMRKDLETEYTKREREIAAGPKGEVAKRMSDLVEDMNLRKDQAQKEFVDRANVVIARIGQQENFDAVFLEAAYAAPRVDLTDKVIQALDSAR